MNKVIVLGNGQIGKAVKVLLQRLIADHDGMKFTETVRTLNTISGYLTSKTFYGFIVEQWDKQEADGIYAVDFETATDEDLARLFAPNKGAYVINALPFFLNEKIARAAATAKCHYIDFTEDDEMADKVQALYKDTGLKCAVKCGLAPGFINYVGHHLAQRVKTPRSLMISVGALPKDVNYSDGSKNYNLSWSVDGLVNEYLRPCRVRMHGKELKVQPLTGLETVLIDGVAYEAAFTSGGIGSLVKELSFIPNVAYKTLRYPGHYEYVKKAVQRCSSDFAALKEEFLNTFPFNKNDVIIVYAECTGKDEDGRLVRETFSSKFNGIPALGLSAIQATTAGGGLVVLEMMINGYLTGTINHSSVKLDAFRNTDACQHTYQRSF